MKMNVTDNIISIHWPWPPDEKIPWDTLTNGSLTHCDDKLHIKNVGEVVVLSTAAVIFVLFNIIKWIVTRSITQVAVPVDLLATSPHRLVYCVILTIWAADVFKEGTDMKFYYFSPDNTLLDAFSLFGLTPVVIFLRQSLMYLPVLCCVSFILPCLGHYIGLLYTLLMGCYNMYLEALTLSGCSNRGRLPARDVAVSLSVLIPVYLGYVGVALWFFWRAVMETALLLFTKVKVRQYNPDAAHYHKHVQDLLKKRNDSFGRRREITGKPSLSRFTIWGLHYVLPFRVGLKFPLAFLAPICMASMVIYQLCVQTMNIEIKLVQDLKSFVDSFNITVEAISTLIPDQQQLAHTVLYDFQSLAESLHIILPLACCVGFGLCVLFNMYMVQNFHKRLLRATRGDINFLTASEPLPSKPYILAAGMKFSAFQMSYMVFAWVIYTILFTALQLIGLIFYYLFKNFQLVGVRVWSFFMVPMIWAVAIHFLQVFLCRYVFLKRKEKGDLIHVRFRSVYLLFTYLFFFFNFLSALVLAFLRVFGSFMFTMVMFFRIDWDVYMRGLEGWDFGHRTYVGYMYLEYTHNNAVLRTFVQLLSNHTHLPCRDKNLSIQHFSHTSSSSSTVSNTEAEAEESGQVPKSMENYAGSRTRATNQYHTLTSRRARNLWLVAYTLIHNPQLRTLTASQIDR